MSNENKWKEFCSQQDSCESCKYKGDCDCEVEFWKDWARADERANMIEIIREECFGFRASQGNLVRVDVVEECLISRINSNK